MRRFKKKLLGWLTPKIVEVVCVQTFRVAKLLPTIEGNVLEVKELSKNITMIRYEKV
jgi:hypothetical protein